MSHLGDRILAELHKHPHGLHVDEIATVLQEGHTQVSKNLVRMRKHWLVEAIKDGKAKIWRAIDGQS